MQCTIVWLNCTVLNHKIIKSFWGFPMTIRNPQCDLFFNWRQKERNCFDKHVKLPYSLSSPSFLLLLLSVMGLSLEVKNFAGPSADLSSDPDLAALGDVASSVYKTVTSCSSRDPHKRLLCTICLLEDHRSVHTYHSSVVLLTKALDNYVYPATPCNLNLIYKFKQSFLLAYCTIVWWFKP